MNYNTSVSLSGVLFNIDLSIESELVYIEKIKLGEADFTQFFKQHDLGEEIQEKLGNALLDDFLKLSYQDLKNMGYSSYQIKEEEYRFDFQKIFIDKSFYFA